jgi:multidrug efflux pump subunit AcrA (membrane-fusion protein)
MALREASWTVGLVLATSAVANAQGAAGNPNQLAAKVERAMLHLTPADRYRLPLIVEPLRKVIVMAPSDGVLRSIAVPVGSTVQEGQEIARLDTNAALTRYRVAKASVKEMQAEVDIAKSAGNNASLAIAEARLEAAKARAELAQIEVESCTLRAPFAGRVMDVAVSPGQYLSKGSAILDLADVATVRVLLPVDRGAATVGGSLAFAIEETPVTGKVQAVLPLGEAYANLRELASPLAAAWVTVANTSGTFEPGQRAHSPFLPNAPIAGVPSFSIHKDDSGNSIVQVIRAERVTDVPIKVLGSLGPDRSQISGPFRTSDILIQTSSVPLRAGTFIRFNDGSIPRGIEGSAPSPDQVGDPADVSSTPPGIAPIGSGGRPKPGGTKPKASSTKAGADGVVPF